jgi:hypothetical protein
MVPDKTWVLDSPANNAAAHDLHNLLFLLGDEYNTSATPVQIEAETYRARDIASFDTIAARIHLEGTDAELLFTASHAIAPENALDPAFIIEFEYATVEYLNFHGPIVVTYRRWQARFV